jgi:sugar lactone lactonase YvrE
LDGIVVSNSLAFDRVRRHVYFADSPTKSIRRGTFDGAHTLMGWETFARGTKGYPDGSCVDAEGYLWNAEWAGSRIVRYAPSGKVDRVLPVPVTRPSACTFGGKDNNVLYVTSARYNMTEEELEKDPDAGSLYAVELADVRGLPADRFGR